MFFLHECIFLGTFLFCQALHIQIIKRQSSELQLIVPKARYLTQGSSSNVCLEIHTKQVMPFVSSILLLFLNLAEFFIFLLFTLYQGPD